MKAFTLGKPEAMGHRSGLLRELQPSLNPWKELSFYRTQVCSVHSIFPVCGINLCKNPCLGIWNCNPHLPLWPALSLSLGVLGAAGSIKPWVHVVCIKTHHLEKNDVSSYTPEIRKLVLTSTSAVLQSTICEVRGCNAAPASCSPITQLVSQQRVQIHWFMLIFFWFNI